jgi:hypothetical protein
MANDPKAAQEKRAGPTHRLNAQGDHEGSALTPEAFDAMNPQKQVTKPTATSKPPTPRASDRA